MAKYVVTENEKRIIEGVSIPQYYNEHIVPNRKGFRTISNEKPSGLCPFHSDTDPSLHFWRENKSFKCFGCGTAGSVVNMHMQWQKVEYHRYIDKQVAIQELAKMYGIELEVDETGNLKVESVFESARKKAEHKQYEGNPFDMTKLTIAGFRTFNNQLKSTIERNPYTTDEQAIQLYEKLDLTLSAYLAKSKETRNS